MQQGDVVIAIDGKPVRDPNQLRLEITSKAPGSTVDVKLIRNNAERTLKVKLDPLPNDQNGIEDEENDKGDKTKPDELERFGMRFESLTPEARRQINAPPSLTGVVVSEVFEGSSAEQQGVQPGDLIVQINRQSVKSSKEAQALLREELRKNKSKARVLLLIWSQGYTRFVSVRAASE
jgi:serine protease Do